MRYKRIKENPEVLLGALALIIAGVVIGIFLLTGRFSHSDTNSAKPVSGESVIININTADIEELKKLDGISDVTAQNIIDYREANGGFSTVEELKEVKGIGETRFKSLRNYIRTE